MINPGRFVCLRLTSNSSEISCLNHTVFINCITVVNHLFLIHSLTHPKNICSILTLRQGVLLCFFFLFFMLGTINILSWIILCCGRLCIVGCEAASLLVTLLPSAGTPRMSPDIANYPLGKEILPGWKPLTLLGTVDIGMDTISDLYKCIHYKMLT